MDEHQASTVKVLTDAGGCKAGFAALVFMNLRSIGNFLISLIIGAKFCGLL